MGACGHRGLFYGDSPHFQLSIRREAAKTLKIWAILFFLNKY